MCGGIENIHPYDIFSTQNALEKIGELKNYRTALECGCGIGRISTSLLYKYFEKIDLLERNNEFLGRARLITKELELTLGKKIFYEFFNSSLENFNFPKCYDFIFIQWVLEYLTEDELEEFLKKCSKNLNNKGSIFIKENVNEELIYFELEGSWIRTKKHYEDLFHRNGLKIVNSGIANLGRTDLYEVYYWTVQKL